ncbi:MAG: hypothetical protein ABIJ97_16085 [Bacteroidota bacterium]
MDISSWWDAMLMLEKVYWLIAIPFTLIFIFLMIASLFGGDTDMEVEGSADAEVGSDEGISFQFISIKNIAAFFTIFGWVGIACIRGDQNTLITLIISVGSGLAIMTLMASIYYFMGKLAYSGTLEMKNAIGKTGTIYLTIPEKRTGFGQVQIKIQGSLRTLDAMTDEEESIKTGSLIDVVDVKDDNILIVKRSTN